MWLKGAMGNNGYTLVELMTVLVLAGLGVAIAAPPLASTYERTASRTARDQFVSTHSLARSMAVRYGRVAELHIDASGARFWVEVDTSSIGGMNARVGVTKDLNAAKVLLTSDRSMLCFDVRGLPTTRGACEAADATLTFSVEGKADTVKITALGKVLR